MTFKRALFILLALTLLPGIALAQGVTARFEVNKIWVDTDLNVASNPDQDVVVELVCTTGLPLTQEAVINSGPGGGVVFVVEELLDLASVDCTISEKPGAPAGYKEWSISSGNGGLVEGGCVFTGGQSGNAAEYNTCTIYNQAVAGTVTVTTEWDILNTGGDAVDTVSNITIRCNEQITGGTTLSGGYSYYYDTLIGDDSTGPVTVNTRLSGTTCDVSDDVVASSVEKLTNCDSSLTVLPGGSDGCSFQYTVFFEGIPTLSQYGLAIMALLMLGVGFVGLRRFV